MKIFNLVFRELRVVQNKIFLDNIINQQLILILLIWKIINIKNYSTNQIFLKLNLFMKMNFKKIMELLFFG